MKKKDNKSRNELEIARILLITALVNAISTLLELIIKLISLE